jgi:GT2 family glycosyltransferase
VTRPPDVSIVVVSWNTREYLARALAAVRAAAPSLETESIVVDNGSSDGTQTMLAERFPAVRLIQNTENVGFGRASNLGAHAARGRALLVLNSDCELLPGALRTMLAALDADPSTGGVVCRLVNPDGTLQPSVHHAFPSPWGLFGELCFWSSLRYAVYRSPVLNRALLGPTRRRHRRAHDVAWAGAACVLIRRQAFEAVGGFDEQFVMYSEDVDLCKRLRDRGYRLRYVPEAEALHHWGRSTAQRPAAMLLEAYRSRIRYFDKHFPGWGGSLARGLTSLELWIRRAVWALLALAPSRHRETLRARARATAACLAALPRARPARSGSRR